MIKKILAVAISLCVFTTETLATGYYNMGARWRTQNIKALALGTIGTFTNTFTSNVGSGFGPDDGMMNNPTGVAVDSGGYLYVADMGNNRINKYNSSTGAFIGWIGGISTSPTGGAAGCNGAGAGTITPGWCTGGTSTAINLSGGYFSPSGVAVDSSGFLYVTDTSHRVSKINASTGAFVGWLGKIGSTGGTCTVGVGLFSGGWCNGGNSASGTGDGMLNGPQGIAADSTNNALYVADTLNHRIQKFNLSTGAFIGWMGKIATIGGTCTAGVSLFSGGWCNGGTSSSGTGDGMMNNPYGVSFDSSNNYLYVSDTSNSRVQKFNLATGVFIGWIGKIATVGGTCTAGVNTFTGSWCSGGTSGPGGNDGMLNSNRRVAVDASNNFLYVADYGNSRIQKYTLSTGAFVGWIGKIFTSTTGGPTGCTGAAVGIFTPGFCTGGASIFGLGDGMMKNALDLALDSGGNLFVADTGNHRINKYTSSTGSFIGADGTNLTIQTWSASASTITGAGNGDGMLNGPMGLTVDASGNLYIADSVNGRISKFNATTGNFIGWIGRIATSPTGGAAGCNGAPAGTQTPGWCTGGTSTVSTSSGGLSYPTGMFVDSAGNLYVGDWNAHRVNKFNAITGTFIGWIGKIGSTGGTCTAGVGLFTGGWCSGGTSVLGTGDGMFNSAQGIFGDLAGNLYVADGNNRINKFNAASGSFIGWIGKISSSPTGGAAGCNGAGAGTITPGWCTGGTSTAGVIGDGSLNFPKALSGDTSGNLYVGDYNNSRICKYNYNSGTFLGWIGRINSSPTGGATGCNGAAVGTQTLGWCTGGSAQAGNGTGHINLPYSVLADSGGNLFVGDNNNRITKYKASTGAPIGWMGKIATSPTAGAAACKNAAVGTATPGWCTGGTSTFGTGNGMFMYPMGMSMDSSGLLYVSDNGYNRILKLNTNP
jgi:DNA-binding beta-propeller fold protein YncE